MIKKVDFHYCCSSFLTFRSISKNRKFFEKSKVFKYHWPLYKRKKISNSDELLSILEKRVNIACKNNSAALCLSGGIDSAILAKLMPKGSVAYTFRCVVPGVKVKDESEQAAEFATICGLKHKIIDITWDDFERYIDVLEHHKGQPIHSIEIQIYKACLQAKMDGFDTLIFGESADCNFGGLDNLLSKDFSFNEFVDRFTYVSPNKVLKQPNIDLSIFKKYYSKKDRYFNTHEFLRHVFFQESVNSYINACSTAGITCVCPFAYAYLKPTLDIDRIRSGDTKYIVRDIFTRYYPSYTVPKKLPMPRATNEWLKDYRGPKSSIFKKINIDEFSGDQKWMIYSLDRFIITNFKK